MSSSFKERLVRNKIFAAGYFTRKMYLIFFLINNNLSNTSTK